MTAGRVAVNGETVRELGAKVDPASDRVSVDGRVVRAEAEPLYYVLDKPAGYLTTMSDMRGRPTVAELLPRLADGTVPPGLFPVGRLDKDTTGLLLLTTDGELGHRLAHPSFHVPKTYSVVARGRLREANARRLAAGIELEDGPSAPAEVRILRAGTDRSEAEITIREGRKRQVRRMFDALGHPVLELRRIRFGPVTPRGVKPGGTRKLTWREIAALRAATGMVKEE